MMPLKLLTFSVTLIFLLIALYDFALLSGPFWGDHLPLLAFELLLAFGLEFLFFIGVWFVRTPTYHKLVVLRKLRLVPREHNQLSISRNGIRSWYDPLWTHDLRPIAHELDMSSVPLALLPTAAASDSLTPPLAPPGFDERLDFVNRFTINSFDMTSLTFAGERYAVGRYVARIKAKRELTPPEQQAFDALFRYFSQVYDVVRLLDSTVPIETALHYYRMHVEGKARWYRLSPVDQQTYGELVDQYFVGNVYLSLQVLRAGYERSMYTVESLQPLCWQDFFPSDEEITQHKRWERLPFTSRETPAPSKRLT